MCCAEAPAASKWIVCVASPNTKCRNAVYTIILSVKFLSKNASYNLELHNLHLSKTYNLKKNELILYDFGKGSSPLCLPALKKKKTWLLFRNPHVSRDKIPILPRSRYVFDQHPRRVCATSAWCSTNPRKTTTVWTTRILLVWFFSVKKKKHKAQTKQGMVRLRKKVCLKGNVN